MKQLFVIDVSGYIFRAYHALPPMTNKEGQGTQALFGFIRAILKLLKDFSPEHLVAVFEGEDNKRKRLAIYKDYKATRDRAPEDLPQQMIWAAEFCRLMGMATLSIEGVEADDTMGSLAVWAARKGVDVFLCTSDKDLYQFVDGHVKILQTHKDNLLLDHHKVVELIGVEPAQIVDYLAIIGDSSDNIPGIPGLGPKSAAALLNTWGSLQGIYENIAQVTKKRALLEEHKERAFLSRSLALIETDLAVPQDEDFYRLKEAQPESLQEFYRVMNFTSLISTKKAEKVEGRYTVACVNEALFQELMIADLVAFDCETTGLDVMSSTLVGVGFSWKKGEGVYLPVYRNKEAELFLQKVFAARAKPWAAHNAKFDLHALKRAGIDVKATLYDTMLFSYLLFSEQRQHSLAFLAEKFLGQQKASFEELVGKGLITDVPVAQVANYCGLDADLTLQLYHDLRPKIEARGLGRLLEEIEVPLLRVLFAMEEKGIFLDRHTLALTGHEVIAELAAVQERIFGAVGESFNLNSPKQLAAILFDRLQLPEKKKTSTGQRSTNAEVLEELAAEHPLVGDILHYRMLEKLRSTYIEALPSFVNAKTGRIHPFFNQFVAATGRLSCQDPNLQNIPVRNRLGRAIRRAFRPEKEGCLYLAADYSQIELRMLAHMSEDPVLVAAFEADEDIHAYTASLIFNTALQLVTAEQRRVAKVVNFGIIYGQQPFGLSKELKCSMKEAALFIDLYFARYPQVKAFLMSCKEKARASGYALTMTGRQREIADITSRNNALRTAAERLAINTPLQGSAADLIKMAMISADQLQQNLQSRMILQIHDELLFEMNPAEEEALKKVVITAMQGVMKLKVPLKVDIAIGKNWEEC